jgi:NAD(P)-dependent dehydrogenase (short-subunit alcohol dehydrogenase family)
MSEFLPYHLTPATQIEHEWERPGLQYLMPEEPVSSNLVDLTKTDEHGMPALLPYVPRDLLKDKVALITGGDSGIGASVAYMFAAEGADVAIIYLPAEQTDAEKIHDKIVAMDRACLLVPCDIGYEFNCRSAVDKVVAQFGRIDILVNNAGEQHLLGRLEDLTGTQLVKTFRTNVFGPFLLTKYVLGHMPNGSSIINTTSVVAYRGSGDLLDYGATKAALVGFTRCLAKQLMPRKIRVNAVAPGPVTTPLQNISRDEANLDDWGNHTDAPQGRVGHPCEIATSYVFLASAQASAFNGQTLHPNQWEIYNA